MRASVVRGCGSRERGGLYFETHVGRDGTPFHKFVICPPIPIDADAAGIPHRGVSLIERQDGSGVVDIWDRVGVDSYPNVADVIEETRLHGLSRRAPRNMDYSRLDRRSQIILLHDRAVVVNARSCYDALSDEEDRYNAIGVTIGGVAGCPARHDTHAPDKLYGTDTACGRLWYETVVDGGFALDPGQPPRTVVRRIGSTSYTARRWFARADYENDYDYAGGYAAPAVTTGVFLILPVHNFAVINGHGSEKSSHAAARSSLPVYREDA